MTEKKVKHGGIPLQKAGLKDALNRHGFTTKNLEALSTEPERLRFAPVKIPKKSLVSGKVEEWNEK